MDARGRPVTVIATPGQHHDIRQAKTLLAEHTPKYVIADKAYDSDEFLAEIQQRGSIAVIPPCAGRTVRRRLHRRHYRRRNQVERFVNRIKHFRRVATRYEKHVTNFLGFVQLTALMCWLN